MRIRVYSTFIDPSTFVFRCRSHFGEQKASFKKTSNIDVKWSKAVLYLYFSNIIELKMDRNERSCSIEYF